MKSKKILIIDHDKAVGNLAKFTLKTRGFHVNIEFDHRKGFAFACNNPPDLIILGHHLPGIALTQLIKDIFSVDELSKCHILVRTDEHFKGSPGKLKQLGVKAVLQSPFDTGLLAETVFHLLHEEKTNQSD